MKDSIKRFEIEHPLPKGYICHYLDFDNTYENYVEKSDLIADRIIKHTQETPNVKRGAAFIGYGYATGAIESNDKKIALTHQRYYTDTPVWSLNVAGPLNIDADNVYYANGYTESNISDNREERKDIEIGEYLKWLINPNGNEEIADEVFRRICYPMVKEVCSKLPSHSNKEIRVIMPLLSSQVDEPDWNTVFSELKLDSTRLIIEGPSCLLAPRENERIYVVYRHLWEFGLATIVHAVQLSQNGSPVTIGAYAYITDDGLTYFDMKSVGNGFVHLSASTSIGNYLNRSVNTNDDKHFYTEPHIESSQGFLSYLGSHSSSFYLEYYSKIAGGHSKNEIQRRIVGLVPEKGSVQVAQICAALNNERNLSNIALSDMVSVGIAMESKGLFKPTTLVSKRIRVYATSKYILPSQNYKIKTFPANYGEFVWKCLDENSTKEDYFFTSENELKKLPIAQLISKIVRHFSHPTTSDIADELLYIYGYSGDPTALFTARLFGYMMSSDRFCVESKFEEVDEIILN